MNEGLRDNVNKVISGGVGFITGAFTITATEMIFSFLNIGQIQSGSIISILNLTAPALPIISLMTGVIVGILAFQYCYNSISNSDETSYASKTESIFPRLKLENSPQININKTISHKPLNKIENYIKKETKSKSPVLNANTKSNNQAR